MSEDDPGKHRRSPWAIYAWSLGAGVAAVGTGSTIAFTISGESVVVGPAPTPGPTASALPSVPVASSASQAPRVPPPRTHQPAESVPPTSTSQPDPPPSLTTTAGPTDQPTSGATPMTPGLLQPQEISGDVGRHLYTVLFHGTGWEPSTQYYIDVDGHYCDSVVTDPRGEFFQNVSLPPLGTETVPVVELVNTTTGEPTYVPVNLGGLIQGLLQGVTGLIGHVLGAVVPSHSLF